MSDANGERPEVFRGHIEECFRHIGNIFEARIPKGQRGASQNRKPMADFCGIGVGAVAVWIREGSLPRGEELLKLMCYLDMVGYKVIELERLSPARRNFLELIGFRILTIDQAATLLGYSSVSQVSQVLQGKIGSSDDKDNKMWNAWKERRTVLSQRKIEDAQKFKLSFSLLGSESVPAQPAAPLHMRVVSPKRRLVVCVMSCLNEMLDDEDTMQDIKSSVELVLALSGKLSSLSSRLIQQDGQKGGTSA